MTKLKRSLTTAILIVAANLIFACGSMAPREARQWQPTAVNDFKSVAGKWEGLLIRSPRTPDDDWVTIVISETGAYEFVSYRTIGVFAGKGMFALTDGKLSAKSDKGGQITLQPYVDRGGSDRMLKIDAKDSEGFTYSAELKRIGASRSVPSPDSSAL